MMARRKHRIGTRMRQFFLSGILAFTLAAIPAAGSVAAPDPAPASPPLATGAVPPAPEDGPVAHAPAPEPATPEPAAPEPVALELLLAVDGSASISTDGLAFQLLGHAAAFHALAEAWPASLSGTEAGSAGHGMAVALAVWSGPGDFVLWQPWQVLRSGADAAAFALALTARAAEAQDVSAGSTAIGAALDHAVLALLTNRYRGERLVIDLVSNGFSNAGIAPQEARDRASLLGVTVNALVIPDEFPWLESYFAENVITGPDAFVVSAEGGVDFVTALLRKLVREMA